MKQKINILSKKIGDNALENLKGPKAFTEYLKIMKYVHKKF